MGNNLRMPSTTNVVLAGRLCHTPELHNSGPSTLLRLRLATDLYRGKDKEKETLWCEVTCFGALAERLAGTLLKGEPVLVEGRINGIYSYMSREVEPTPKATLQIHANNVSPLTWAEDRETATTPQPAARATKAAVGEPEDADHDLPF